VSLEFHQITTKNSHRKCKYEHVRLVDKHTIDKDCAKSQAGVSLSRKSKFCVHRGFNTPIILWAMPTSGERFGNSDQQTRSAWSGYGVQSGFISKLLQARTQVSVCSGYYLWHPQAQTDRQTDTQTVLCLDHVTSSASWDSNEYSVKVRYFYVKPSDAKWLDFTAFKAILV